MEKKLNTVLSIYLHNIVSHVKIGKALDWAKDKWNHGNNKIRRNINSYWRKEIYC